MTCLQLVFLLLKLKVIYGSLSGCVHGGVKFKHGDHFLPSDPLVVAEFPGQCLQCRCDEGVVICEMENCPHVICDTPVRMNDYCCPQCPASAITNVQGKPSTLTFSTGNTNNRRKNGCMSGNKFHKEGSSWQPFVGPMGYMACVQCTCRASQITCQRYQCHEPPCSRPRRQFGFCCPVCPLREVMEKSLTHCLPRASEVFVYKTSSKNKLTDLIQFGFVLDSTRSKIELHSWTTHSTGTDSALTVSIISKAEMLQLHLDLIGSSSYKHWVRFARREERLQHRCTIQCREKLSRLEQTLKLYPVAERPRCYDSEVDTASII